MSHRIVNRNGRREVVLDPRSDKGVGITADRIRYTELVIDGTRDAFLLPPGSQWHLVPEALWQTIQRELVELERRLRDRGEDAVDRAPALAADMLTAAMARDVPGGN